MKSIHGARTYKTTLMWAYAIAPPVAGLMGNLMFHPADWRSLQTAERNWLGL